MFQGLLAESDLRQSQYINQYIPEFAQGSGNPRNPYVQVTGVILCPRLESNQRHRL